MEGKYRSIYRKLKTFEEQGQEFSHKTNTSTPLTIEVIKKEKAELLNQFEDYMETLKNISKHSRSSHQRDLAQIQLDYFQKMKHFLGRWEDEEEVEVHLLHSEFSIDLAKQSLVYAFLSLLHSIDKQKGKN
jgi:chromatin segregation and condensation protein Rec8/ScpA/Scc1 (kleisin family)